MRYNLFSLYLAAFAFLFSSLSAREFLVETKAAYYSPIDSLYRSIYGEGALYGVEITGQVCGSLYGWISGEYLHKCGSSLGESNPTTIDIVPLGLGLKQVFPCKDLQLYLGGGLLATHVQMKDDSPFAIPKVSKWGIGGIVKVGALYPLSKHFFFDLFANASYMKIDFHDTNSGTVIRNRADLGNCLFGIGIGYRFPLAF